MSSKLPDFIRKLPTGPYDAEGLRKILKQKGLPVGAPVSLQELGILTLYGEKITQSEALFVTEESFGPTRETARVRFAGKDRYFFPARKVNAIVRRQHQAAYRKLGLSPPECIIPDQLCCECAHCAEYGGLVPDKEKSIGHRVKFDDLISVEEYHEEEKFRSVLPERERRYPTPYGEIVVPPNTHFLYSVRIYAPTKWTLASFLYANMRADQQGYGSYAKIRGRCITKWEMLALGLPYLSHEKMIADCDSGKSLELQLQEFIQNPKGEVIEAIGPKEAENVTDSLIIEFQKCLQSGTLEGSRN